MDQQFDDFNFIDAYYDTQHELRCARNQVSDAEYRIWKLEERL